MIKHLWHTHRVALLAFIVALAALGYFGVKTVSSAIYWMDPAHQEQPLAGWMTPRYVGQSYRLPREIVLEALMMDPNAPPQRISVGAIAAKNGVTLEELQDRVSQATALWDAAREPRRDD
jgi:hypothetical protein